MTSESLNAGSRRTSMTIGGWCRRWPAEDREGKSRDCWSHALPVGKSPRQAKPQLMHGFAADLCRAHAGVERKAVAHAPDRADEERIGTRAVTRPIGKDFRYRSHRPGEWPLEDRAEKEIGLVLARTRQQRIEMNRRGLPALRDDASDRKPGAARSIHFRQKHAIFRRDAYTGPVLQHAGTQHVLDRDGVVDQRRARLALLAVERDLVAAFEHELIFMRETKVRDHRGRLQKTLAALTQPLQRSELDLRFACLGDVRIGRIERSIGERRADTQQQRGKEPGSAHGSGVSVPYHASEPLISMRTCEPSRSTW